MVKQLNYVNIDITSFGHFASWRSLGPPGMALDVGMSELLRMIALPAMSNLAPGSCRQQKGACMSQVDSLAYSAEHAAGG